MKGSILVAGFAMCIGMGLAAVLMFYAMISNPAIGWYIYSVWTGTN